MGDAQFERDMANRQKHEDATTREDFARELALFYGESDDPKSEYQKALAAYDAEAARGAEGADEKKIGELKEGVRKLWEEEKRSAAFAAAAKQLHGALEGKKKKFMEALLTPDADFHLKQ